MWRRFAVNASVLTVSAALEEARDELSDPVSDRVIETFVAAHERGQAVVVDVLLNVPPLPTHVPDTARSGW